MIAVPPQETGDTLQRASSHPGITMLWEGDGRHGRNFGQGSLEELKLRGVLARSGLGGKSG
jgi:hypothetical protein